MRTPRFHRHNASVLSNAASTVLWAYFLFGIVFAIGLVEIIRRGRWQHARGLDKLVLFGPLFYAAPIAGFGTEHFTVGKAIAAVIPAWIPAHLFCVYVVGACLIAAGFSLVTGIQARLAAGLLALMFFLFVLIMDLPSWAHTPGDRFAAALALRETAFSGGALALAATLTEKARGRGAPILVAIARYFIAIPVLFYSLQQFLHADHVAAIPLDRLTPPYIPARLLWTYLCAAAYAVLGILLLAGRKTRVAATSLGLTVFFVELVVYVPIGVADRATIVGFNYMADTLMFCGAILLLAGALPHEP